MLLYFGHYVVGNLSFSIMVMLIPFPFVLGQLGFRCHSKVICLMLIFEYPEGIII